MTSHGKVENEKLRKNLEEQLDRLLQELEDLDECREELGEDSYAEAKESTMEQLREFNERLQRLTSGNVSLIGELGAMQLAIQAAISAAFKTPAVIRMFGKREPNQLRAKMSEIDRDIKLGKLNPEAGDRQKGEIVNALKQLGEKLEPAEETLLEKLALDGFAGANFVKVSDNVDKSQIALSMAGKQIQAAKST